MQRTIVLLAIFWSGYISVLPACPAWAAELEDQLIINDVYTRVGQDFYQRFCRVWNSFQGIPISDIVITEESSGRAMSKLQVLVGGSVAYVGMISQRGSDVRAEVDRAVALSFRHVVQNITGAEEVAPELSGPGIGSGI
ncbi:CsgE family curli-type amyloid fiber assembly protein [Desulfocurvibacter africanus]|uniref:Curli production assembly/transport component CsgE n=1 Tax=Desulfocurvibacter africanus subsp. africanus str. Walvis Bay TaxID=690850 RepID=F3Z093_DESAF|nr:CsgE family curli-type amyloid fiber assembly protein [Desulfocurvibacter africanus]EGJ49795.1 Curli assembly protein CsgE [Desulfocurvibacter africanus subsp. africanus str. Walvis Bay]